MPPATTRQVALSYSIKSIELIKYSTWLCQKFCANVMEFQ
ncbi:hypothetical protein D1AOALGA4SA_7605 [Olavius algarvensis Delta 1 endosymbiont]|nr:hypothetical protein D1AOALGA4SA_7605 [Olavius algarvensis Delta 1 endosymbiont]